MYLNFICRHSFQILECLDDNYEEEAVLFMGVLNELAKAVVRWFPSDPGETNSNMKDSTESVLRSHNSVQKEKEVCGENRTFNQSSCDAQSADKPTCQGDSINLPDLGEQTSSEVESDEGRKKCQSLDDSGHYDKESCDTEVNVPLNKNVVDLASSVVLKKVETDVAPTPAEELTEFFTEFLELERQASGQITDEDIENIRYFHVTSLFMWRKICMCFFWVSLLQMYYFYFLE